MSETIAAPPVAAANRIRTRLRTGYRVDLIEQHGTDDCAIACLATVLRHFGREVEFSELRTQFGGFAGGADLEQMVRVARRQGLRPTAFSLSLDELSSLAPGSILHWDFDHFVVFGGRRGDRYEIHDPARGSALMSQEDVSASFTGVALEFERTVSFEPAQIRSNPLAPYIARILGERGELFKAVALSVGTYLLGLTAPALLAIAVERYIPAQRADWVLIAGISLGGIALGTFIVAWMRGRVLGALSVTLESILQGDFYERILHLRHDFVSRYDAGDLLQRGDAQRDLRRQLSELFLSTSLDAFSAVIYFVAIVALNSSTATLLLVAALCQGGLAVMFRPRRERLFTKLLRHDGEVQARQVEMISSLRTIKAMGREAPMLARWVTRYTERARSDLEVMNFEAVVNAVSRGLNTLTPALVLLTAGVAAASGELSLGALFALSALAPGFVAPLSGMISTWVELASARSIARRVQEVITGPSELEHPGRKAVRLRGHVELRNVSFAYHERQPVLRDVSLSIEPGQTVAIVGETGCGKSTLLRLLTGMLQPNEGQVRFDGHEVADLELGGLRRQIGLVPQEVELLRGSIRSNISFGLRVTEDQIVSAARAAALHDRIMDDAYGYDAPVSEGGLSLSGGERQRLALARALVGGPQVLLLDEATSALDVATERTVQAALDELACTRIIVAHRLSTVRDADQILVMRRGTIVEAGTHEVLVRHDGEYARMLATQQQTQAAQ